MAYTWFSSGSSASRSSTTGTSQLYSDEKNGSSSNITTDLNNRYSDLDLNMIPHPQKKDIIPLKGELAVRNAVKNLVVTSFYERPFNSQLGSNLRSLLFEPADAITKLAIEGGIQKVLEFNEPRIENINIIANIPEQGDQYNVVVIFSIKANDSIQEVEINLRKLR